jgi:REP element-mobilizing transposase RayT
MANTYSNLLYHIVFSTRNRQPINLPSFRDELEKYITGIITAEGCALVEIGSMPDHLHIVARFRPDRSVSEMVRLIKANSSKWVNETRGLPERFEWQVGYGAFTGSQSQIEKLRAYVIRTGHEICARRGPGLRRCWAQSLVGAQNSFLIRIRGQEEHHRVRSFQEEYLGFLERHGIAYDECYVWG